MQLLSHLLPTLTWARILTPLHPRPVAWGLYTCSPICTASSTPAPALGFGALIRRVPGQCLAQRRAQEGGGIISKSTPMPHHCPGPSANAPAQPLLSLRLSCSLRAMDTSEKVIKSILPPVREASGMQFQLFRSFS